MYGPTETTIWSTLERVTADSGPVSIGRPIDNTQVYVLDAQRKIVPDGVTGELYIGGQGVTRGYLGRPELTAEKFVNVEVAGGARLYRTGDLAAGRKTESWSVWDAPIIRSRSAASASKWKRSRRCSLNTRTSGVRP